MTRHTCQLDAIQIHKLLCARTGWGATAHIHMLDQVVARARKQCRLNISVSDSTPNFRWGGGEGKSGPDMVSGKGCTLKRCQPQKQGDPDCPHHHEPLCENEPTPTGGLYH